MSNKEDCYISKRFLKANEAEYNYCICLHVTSAHFTRSRSFGLLNILSKVRNIISRQRQSPCVWAHLNTCIPSWDQNFHFCELENPELHQLFHKTSLICVELFLLKISQENKPFISPEGNWQKAMSHISLLGDFVTLAFVAFFLSINLWSKMKLTYQWLMNQDELHRQNCNKRKHLCYAYLGKAETVPFLTSSTTQPLSMQWIWTDLSLGKTTVTTLLSTSHRHNRVAGSQNDDWESNGSCKT